MGVGGVSGLACETQNNWNTENGSFPRERGIKAKLLWKNQRLGTRRQRRRRTRLANPAGSLLYTQPVRVPSACGASFCGTTYCSGIQIQFLV